MSLALERQRSRRSAIAGGYWGLNTSKCFNINPAFLDFLAESPHFLIGTLVGTDRFTSSMPNAAAFLPAEGKVFLVLFRALSKRR